MKIFNAFNLAMVACMVALALLCTSYLGVYLYASNQEAFATYTQAPYVSDVSGTVVDTFAPGEAFVLHLHAIRRPLNCYADYEALLSGPVTYQFPLLRSNIPKPGQQIETYLKVYFQLPPNLPVGDYKWTYIAYPTCTSVSIAPMVLDMQGLVIHVRKPGN